jgi:hypothetical protein
VISILRTSLFSRSASSCRIHVVDFLADVSQVEINLEPLQGHFSTFRLDHRHHSTELNIFSRLLSQLWNEQPPAGHLHVFVKLQSRDDDPRKPEKQNEELEEAEDLRGQLGEFFGLLASAQVV